VRYAIASHPQTPVEVLRTLARYVPKTRHVYGKVGLAVAMHPQASAEVLSMLTRYPKAEVQWLASFVQRLLVEVGEAGRDKRGGRNSAVFLWMSRTVAGSASCP
jgi:hypothetical protein